MAVVERGFVYRLAPTPAQAARLRQGAGVCRLVWNLALEQRHDHARRYRARMGRSLNSAAQCRELTALRAEVDFVFAESVTAQQRVLKALDRAYAFYAGRAGPPRPRCKGVDEALSFAGREVATRQLNRRWSAVRLPKIGWVKYRDTRPHGEVREATARMTPLGWVVALTCRVDRTLRPTGVAAPKAEAVGVDRGVASPLMLSTGEAFALPAQLQYLDRLHRRAQRVVSRRRRGSRRHAKALRRAAALKARAARIARHWRHETTTAIVRRFRTVVLEDLRTRAMTASARGTRAAPGRNVAAKAGLNRTILAVGWAEIAGMLVWKTAERGGKTVFVDARNTSRTCAGCGAVDRRSRKSQAVFVCTTCGRHDHADRNAALNILSRAQQRGTQHEVHRGNAPGVEPGRRAGDEARTVQAV